MICLKKSQISNHGTEQNSKPTGGLEFKKRKERKKETNQTKLGKMKKNLIVYVQRETIKNKTKKSKSKIKAIRFSLKLR